MAGAIVVIEPARLRVRSLPISGCLALERQATTTILYREQSRVYLLKTHGPAHNSRLWVAVEATWLEGRRADKSSNGCGHHLVGGDSSTGKNLSIFGRS